MPLWAWSLHFFRALGGEKDCTVYSSFCIFIIIIVIITTIISTIISISFIVLLNCLYLSPRVSPFVHFSCLSCWAEGEG